ncbi:glycoside hydrolase family 73 protein [Cohnella massiliensis]|uniref:glycoside hydrolase family 73 protein n=1 Tax=Cohnella massiliensis TaxID=1816691 RepID=UPI0009BC6CD5|nr:glycoside hydrolase family 73 protein [Cohnella massiliensis]
MADNSTQLAFFTKVLPQAQADQRTHGVPASLKLAQAALESNWGRSGLTQKANNLFGIKGTGPAGSVTMPTREVVNGQTVTVDAAFRAYHDWSQSIADHSLLLTRPRYAKVLNADGKTAARAAAAAGYATDPNYADKLIAIMDAYDLYRYDAVQEEEPYRMSAEDAEAIIRFLSAGWFAAVTDEDRSEFNRLANELRASAGIPLSG